MISLRLEPDRHPDQSEPPRRLFTDAIRAARRRDNVSAAMRLIFVAWFAAMAIAPRPLARRLARWFLFPQQRPALNHLLGRLQRDAPRAPPPPEMRIMLVTSMVPDADGIGAIPKLLAAQLEGLHERHEVTLVSTFGEDPGQAEAAERLLGSGLDAHILDRRRSASAPRRWRVRASSPRAGRPGTGPGGSSAAPPGCSR